MALSRGDKGKEVREMKGALNMVGCLSAGAVNDEFDFDCMEAVKMFQRQAELDETGEFDSDTRQALNAMLFVKG